MSEKAKAKKKKLFWKMTFSSLLAVDAIDTLHHGTVS